MRQTGKIIRREKFRLSDSLEHEKQNTGADDQEYVDIEYCRVRCHHEPAVTTESVSAGEHFPIPSDSGHALWVIWSRTVFCINVMKRSVNGRASLYIPGRNGHYLRGYKSNCNKKEPTMYLICIPYFLLFFYYVVD